MNRIVRGAAMQLKLRATGKCSLPNTKIKHWEIANIKTADYDKNKS